MDNAWAAIAAIVALIAATTAVFFRLKEREKVVAGPMDNTAADAAGESVNRAFKNNVERINEAGSSDTPADSLADLGNARKRRRE